MIQGCENFGFSLKSAHPICVTRELIGQNFDSHVAFELGVTGAIDLAHPALTEKSRNFERAKSCTYIYRHWNLCGNANCLAGLCPEATKEATRQSRRLND